MPYSIRVGGIAHDSAEKALKAASNIVETGGSAPLEVYDLDDPGHATLYTVRRVGGKTEVRKSVAPKKP